MNSGEDVSEAKFGGEVWTGSLLERVFDYRRCFDVVHFVGDSDRDFHPTWRRIKVGHKLW